MDIIANRDARIAERRAWAPTVAPVLLLLLGLIAFHFGKRLVFHMAQASQHQAFAIVVMAWIGALVMMQIRYQAIPWLLRFVVRGVGAVILVQVMFDSFGAVPPAPNVIFGSNLPQILFFRWAAVLAILAGAASLWRPAFLVPLLYYYIAFRLRIGPAGGIPVVDTDYLSLLDAGSFGTIGALLVVCLTSEWLWVRIPALSRNWPELDRLELRTNAAKLIWACVVGAHLGNYFLSGIAKLRAGGAAPWTWLVGNPTQTAIVIGMERGDNPLATFPWLVQFSWDTIKNFGLFFNIFVLGAQLLCPLASLRVRFLLIFTLLFDAFHIGVFFTLGALFHFWIVMNLIIYSSAWRLRDREMTVSMKVVCCLTTLFGSYAFYTNHLGWLDGAKLASPNFFAITKDGRTVPVPSTYFGIYSYTIAQGGMYIPDDNFSFRIGGNNLNLASWHDATSCGPAIMHHQDDGVTLAAVEKLVHNTDSFMRRNPAVKNDNLYYIYPHHMQSNPWVFLPFNDLSISDIVGYKYVVDSVCLSMDHGRLKRDVKKHTEYEISVGPSGGPKTGH